MKSRSLSRRRARRFLSLHDATGANPRESRDRRFERLEPRVVLDGSAVISEFMAINNNGLTDEDGDVVDWIEVHNPTTEPVDLAGWSLTDNEDNLDKWQFPSVTLAAGEYLLVYASGKDRAVPGSPLHTDFQLTGAGEFLALVQPDETTFTSRFDPYPPQTQDVSYGLNTEIESAAIVQEGGDLRYLVPTSPDDVPEGWTEADFQDDDWNAGINAIGYDTGETELDLVSGSILAAGPVGYWRLNETSGSSADNLGSFGDSADATYQGGLNQNLVGPRPPQFQNFEADNTAARFDGANDYVGTSSSMLSNLSAFTMMGWVRGNTQSAGRVGLFGQNDAIEFGLIDPNTIQIWTPGGGSLNVSNSITNGQWHHLATTGDGANLRVYVDGNLVGTGGGATGNYGSSGFNFNIGGGGIYDGSANWFTGDIDEVAVFHRALSQEEIRGISTSTSTSVDFDPFIQTDVRAEMLGVNSSALVRTEFTLDEASEFDQLTLGVRFDDGFVAYVNGQEIVRRNAPETVQWNSAATEKNPDSEATRFASFDITDFAEFLSIGDNVLAVQALNLDADNTDFLISTRLDGASVTLTSQPRYFAQPTPEGPNGTGVEDLGPILSGQAHSPHQPTAAQSVVVTVDVAPSFNPVADVQLHYLRMYNAAATIPMVDDGTGVDATAGDGTYSAEIPPGVAAPGEMLRWYVTAEDDLANVARWPLFASNSGRKQSPEYFGTVVADPATTSEIPILEMFAPNPGAAQTRGGTRASVYYMGEFYDNLFVRQRGGSTTSSPKDSLKFEFNAGEHFRYDPDQDRVEEFNLNTTYSDKAYIRQNLSFETYAEIGNPSSISFPVRMEQNGQFHSVAIFIEQPDDDMLERSGLDPDGALYKMFNEFTSGSSSVEKKTRRDESNADLIAFVNGINGSSGQALTNFVFDNVDIPAVLNYMSGTVLVHQNDHPHKNHYLYRDTNGSGEWLFIPWDHDLTLGSNWVGTSFSDTIYADDDSVPGRASNVQPSHPFIGANAHREWNNHWNRLIDKLLQVPEFREMYLRRLRTTMDQVLQPSSGPGNLSWLDTRLNQLEQQVAGDAQLDYQRWANPWQWGSNQSFAQAIHVIRTQYFVPRRQHLYVTHNVGSSYPNKAGIPNAQPENPPIEFGAIDYNPASGNQDQEFIELRNPNTFAVDISGWELRGGVDHTFSPGVVIPAGGRLYVTPDVAAFRARDSGPRGGLGLFVQGSYDGHLSNFGETIRLLSTDQTEMASLTYEGSPSDPQLYLRVSEINYNPHAPTEEEMASASDPDLDNDAFEFVELVNTGDVPVSLAGVNFSQGIRYTFGAETLQPQERILVVRDQEAFELRYGSGLRVAGQFESGALDNGGELIKLDDANNSTIVEFEYDDDSPWPERADGGGSSIELLVMSSPEEGESWRASAEFGGTPAAEGTGPTTTVVINEVLSHTDPPQVDTVELYNASDVEIDVSGWYLSDSDDDYRKYRFPVGTVVPAGGYLTVDESDFNSSMGTDPKDFALDGAHGDQLHLLAANDTGRLTRFVDQVSFGAAANGESFGLWPDAGGVLYPMTEFTPGAANSGPRIGPVVINEVNYHPSDPGPEIDADDLEFVEIHNPTAAPVDLTGWRLGGGIEFAFPDGTMIGADQLLVIVSFDPTDPSATDTLAAFRTAYAVDEGLPLLGGYSGRLDNAGEVVRLLRPDEPPIDEPDFVPMLLEDELAYDDEQPWNVLADGDGASLNRADDSAWGHDPAGWEANGASPGSFEVAPRFLSVEVNGALSDPEDVNNRPQPSSWRIQRSMMRTIVVHFNEPVVADAGDFRLTNLGVNAPMDPDTEVDLTAAGIESVGPLVVITLDGVPDGVYQLEILPTLTDLGGLALDGDGDGAPGDGVLYEPDSSNRFYQFTSDFNGDEGVSIFDFNTFAYWFGQPIPVAPDYVNLNGDDGISIFDYEFLAHRFGQSVELPQPLADREFAGIAVADRFEPPTTRRTGPATSDEVRPPDENSVETPPIGTRPIRSDMVGGPSEHGEEERPADLESVLEAIATEVGSIWLP